MYSRSTVGLGKRRQYDTFLKNKHFARDVLVDLHLNLALFAFPPCKNIDFLILFVKTSHPRRLPNRSIPRKTLPEFEFWLIECIHKLLASSSPLKKSCWDSSFGHLDVMAPLQTPYSLSSRPPSGALKKLLGLEFWAPGHVNWRQIGIGRLPTAHNDCIFTRDSQRHAIIPRKYA